MTTDKEIEILKRFCNHHLGHCHMMCGHAHMTGSASDPMTVISMASIDKSAKEWRAFSEEGTIPEWMQ